MDKKMLEELAEERLKIEKFVVELDEKLKVKGSEYNAIQDQITKQKLQITRLTYDIRSVCREKEPKVSNYAKSKLKKAKE